MSKDDAGDRRRRARLAAALRENLKRRKASASLEKAEDDRQAHDDGDDRGQS